MALDLTIAKKHGQVYGAPLYAQTESAGTLSPGEYTFDAESESLRVPTDEGDMYIRIRSARLEQGINEEVDTFDVHVYTAQRDANGEFNGKAWTVTKGDTRLFAK